MDDLLYITTSGVHLPRLPSNALLCLALIRPLFCIGAIVKPN